MRVIVVTVSVLLGMQGVLACRPRSTPTPAPMAISPRVVTDDLGREVKVPPSPRRIICTSPEVTEILFAVGAGDLVVGVARGCDYPPETSTLPVVGDFSNVSLERVSALRPDLILTTGHEQERMIKQLQPLGVAVVALMPKDIPSVRRDVALVAALVGEEEGGAKVLAALDADLAWVEHNVRRIPEADRPRVYLEISPEPLMTVSRGSFVHDGIVMAGGVNVGADLVRPYCRVDAESVIAANPEVIVLCHGGATPDVVSNRAGWDTIAAVKTGRVYVADADLVLRAGPRLGLGIRSLYGFFTNLPKPRVNEN